MCYIVSIKRFLYAKNSYFINYIKLIIFNIHLSQNAIAAIYRKTNILYTTIIEKLLYIYTLYIMYDLYLLSVLSSFNVNYHFMQDKLQYSCKLYCRNISYVNLYYAL